MENAHLKHVGEIIEVPCHLIRKSKRPQREISNTKGIASLKEDIRKRGQIQPALVRPIGGTSQYDYVLMSGERRWRACTDLKRPLRVIVIKVSDNEEEYAISALANNRQELTPMELCNSLHVLYESKEMQQVSKENRLGATAKRFFGRGHQWAWGYWGLSRLDERLKPLVKQRCSIGEYIPVKIATLLAGLPLDNDPDLQLRAWEIIASGRPKMTVRDAQRYIRTIKQDAVGYVKGRPLPDSYILLERLTKRAAKEFEPYIRMIASGTFTQHLSQYSDTECGKLDDEIADLCGLLGRVRTHLKPREPKKKAS